MTKTLNKRTVDALINAPSAHEIWPIFLRIIHSAGFDHAFYGVNRLRFDGTFGEKTNSFVLSDMPSDVQSAFWDDGLYRHVVAANWAMTNTGAISLEEAAESVHRGEVSQEEHRAHFRMIEFGVTSGYAIGFNKPGATTVAGVGLLNFGKSHREARRNWDAARHEIESYARIFHLKVSSLPLPMNELTNRQRDVLRWVARGKTTAEIATILGLSQATIEKHLRQARENLGAANTAQALLNAQVLPGLNDKAG